MKSKFELRKTKTLKLIANNKDLTNSQLAEKAGLSISTIKRCKKRLKENDGYSVEKVFHGNKNKKHNKYSDEEIIKLGEFYNSIKVLSENEETGKFKKYLNLSDFYRKYVKIDISLSNLTRRLKSLGYTSVFAHKKKV
ncbi:MULTISPECIES: winged helix-turn-helix domain-containing protein [unclassified Mycoplasma]|uniref:winged helix-turn-helix domain-containing protein n=1 Tax=unclassified Mycoplasma TaxID=2683645 RepID=UPI00216B357A|nr:MULTISPECIES: winged helix-turn-helix domain-containing protein [unclassified Mycoplasma]MCS4536633.1 winged helix-turn-helix domain-containing protein [Mycoplasma sp. CSL7475-4]MCT4469547.1 winged helix-turn-helix domain-containing protein [Mycoplasma sp. HS2188]